MPTSEDYEAYFEFLDELRESGVTNMFGAGPYLQRRFPEINRAESHHILGEWMATFGARHPEE